MKLQTTRPAALLSTIALATGVLSACGGAAGGGSEQAACDRFGSKDIRVVVPFDPGGGFDAWARLFAPFIEDHLDGSAQVRVENVPGGGGMKGVNSVYTAAPDGTTLLFTEPGYVIANQIAGEVIDDFDVNQFEFVGSVTRDPDIFYVGANSSVEDVEDLRGAVLKHGNQQTQPQEIILYDALDVDASYILHQGTSDVILSVRRGDTDASRGSLSSILPYIESGEIKPLAHLGLGDVGPEYPGADELEGVKNLEDLGLEELAAAFDYRRVLAAPPETPACVMDKLDEALQQTLADEDFAAKAEAADLAIVPADGAETAANVEKTTAAIGEYADVIRAALQSN